MIRARRLNTVLEGCSWHISFEFPLLDAGIEVAVDNIVDVLQVDNFIPQLKSHGNQRYSVVFTASDQESSRLIEAPILENGKIKIYGNVEHATFDAVQKLRVLQGKA